MRRTIQCDWCPRRHVVRKRVKSGHYFYAYRCPKHRFTTIPSIAEAEKP